MRRRRCLVTILIRVGIPPCLNKKVTLAEDLRVDRFNLDFTDAMTGFAVE